MGEDEKKIVHQRLVVLLDHNREGAAAAQVLIEDLKQANLVSEYMIEKISAGAEARVRGIRMVCLLPQEMRKLAEPYVDQIVSALVTGDGSDPARMALECLGRAGFQALRQEVIEPKKTSRPLAARALAEMKLQGLKVETLEVAETCVGDENPQVRRWCGQSLGKVGAPALPKILALLRSENPVSKEAGRQALHFFSDREGRYDLEQVRNANSGWLANQNKLALARAVNAALMKLEESEAQESVQSE